MTPQEYAALVQSLSTVSPEGIRGVAGSWQTLAGALQTASDGLMQHQADLLATGWSSPATASFSNYVATLQQKAGVLITAAQQAGTALSNAADAAESANSVVFPANETVLTNPASPDAATALAPIAGPAQNAQTSLQASYQQAAAQLQSASNSAKQAMTNPNIDTTPSLGSLSGGSGGSAGSRAGVPEVTGVPLAGSGSGSRTGGRVASGGGGGVGRTSTAGLGNGSSTSNTGNQGNSGAGSAGRRGGSTGTDPAVMPFAPGGGSPSGGFVDAPDGVPHAGSSSFRGAEPPDDPGIHGGIPVFDGENPNPGFGKMTGTFGKGAVDSPYGDGVTGLPLSEAPGGEFSPATGAPRVADNWSGPGSPHTAAGAEEFNPMSGMRGAGYGGYGGAAGGSEGYPARYRIPRAGEAGPREDPGIAGMPLDASPAEETGMPRPFRSAPGEAAPGADGMGGGLPMSPGGVGAPNENDQRGRRRYRLMEPPETWASTAEVVPPVIE